MMSCRLEASVIPSNPNPKNSVLKSAVVGVCETMAPSSKPTSWVRMKLFGLGSDPAGGPTTDHAPSSVSKDSTASPGIWMESTNVPSPWLAQSLA